MTVRPLSPANSLAKYLPDRTDLDLITNMIEPGARVLDVGCGDGELLERLRAARGVDGRGMELSQEGVNASVARGLAVVQGDADTDLVDYPDDAFDFVILSQTIQQSRNPAAVMRQIRRIGRHAIVSFPNFGHWRVRLSLLFEGRMPLTNRLGDAWYDTPNIHLCTLRDFLDLCADVELQIQEVTIIRNGRRTRIDAPGRFANLMAEDAVFLLSRT